jgi:beta-lactam-binding protein with PASTA domain
VLPTTVPHVRELRFAPAAGPVRAARLVPEVVGTQRPDSWVWRQSPRGNAIVPSGSTVTLQLRSGPIP